MTITASPTAGAGLRLERVGRFNSPTYITAPAADRDRVFVTERAGVVRVIRDGKKLRRPFLDIRRRVRAGGESGLLSLAFAPDYRRSRRFYVYYTDARGYVTVDRYLRSRESTDRALPASRRAVLTQAHTTDNHKGGLVRFGPDGKLYVGLGDGGPQKDPHHRGQNLGTLLGKILRIAPKPGGGYRVPRDNPFAGRRGVRHEIWAYGVRNPWRFSFAPGGAFVLGDVGQNAFEEIDYVPGRGHGRPPRGGMNFGWSVFEGRSRFGPGKTPGYRAPLLVRAHGPRTCSIIGGSVVRDRSLGSLAGRYLYGDFCSNRLRAVSLRGGRARGDRALPIGVSGLSSFGEDARGRVYVAAIGGGVYRLARRR
jgi:glucose/arabinose dehydrogenase